MPYIKPATATHASAGIRRMEAELPLCAKDAGALGQRGMAVAGGHGLCQQGASEPLSPQEVDIYVQNAEKSNTVLRIKNIEDFEAFQFGRK